MVLLPRGLGQGVPSSKKEVLNILKKEVLRHLGTCTATKGSLRGLQGWYVRLSICDFFFLPQKLCSASLGKNSVYLHKCSALGLRNDQVDVNSGEEADCSRDNEAVGTSDLLGQETRTQEGMEEERHSRANAR